jgi:two-component system sensor histidine kinase MprB
VVVQLIDADGAVIVSPAVAELPVDDADRAVAASDRPTEVSRDVAWLDGDYAMLTRSLELGGAGGAGGLDGLDGAVQVARSLAETERVLSSLRNVIGLAMVVVVIAAAAAGWLIARQVTRRLVALTGVAERVATTGELDVGEPVGGRDEVGRLDAAFHRMLAALARSREAQHRLVQDAGHELRTPLTSLRTNISVLRRHRALPAETNEKVLDDLDLEARELTTMVDELVELATDGYADEPMVDLALTPLVERVVERARRRTGRVITLDGDATEVAGRTAALERAVSNLVDNAAKFDESGAPIEVTVRQGRVEVLDRGPGIPAADRAHVFDRFYRAVDARSRPGSGLGLAIVRDVVESEGGAVFADDRPGGGAVVGFTLPTR